MLEKIIEKYLCDKVKAAGGIAYKFTSPSRRSVPDRIVLMPYVPTYYPCGCCLEKYDPPRTVFVELKAPGKKPTAAQEREHCRLRDMGFRVEVIDSCEGVDAFMESLS